MSRTSPFDVTARDRGYPRSGHAAGRAWRASSTLLLVAAVVAAGLVAWDAWRGTNALDEARERLALHDLRSGPGAAAAARARSSDPAERARRQALAELSRRLDTDWHSVFDELERALPADVRLQEVEPRVSDASIRLVIAAPSPDAVIRFVRRLDADGVWQEPRLVRHEAATDDTQAGLFTVTARIRPADAGAGGRAP